MIGRRGPSPSPAERDRRRLAVGGAALSAVAVAVAAHAPALSGGRDALPTVSAPSAETVGAGTEATSSFTVRYDAAGPVDAATAQRVDACLALPGVRHGSKASTPPVHGATVTGVGEAEGFAACVLALAGDGVVLTEHRPPPLDTVADIAAFVEDCADGRSATPVPGFVGMTQAEVLAPEVNSRILGRDGVCNPGSPVPDPSIVDVVIADGVVVWAGHLEVPGRSAPTAAAPVPPPDPAGAEVCEGDWGGGGACRDLDRASATALAGALATARRVPEAADECAAPRAVGYRITWEPASGLLDPVVWTVPQVPCLPMEVAGARYDLGQDARDLVAQLWATSASPQPD